MITRVRWDSEPQPALSPGEAGILEYVEWVRRVGTWVHIMSLAAVSAGERRSAGIKTLVVWWPWSGCQTIIAAIKDRKAVSLISDNRRLEGVTGEDQLGLRDTWFPLAVATGLTRIATVLSRVDLAESQARRSSGRPAPKSWSFARSTRCTKRSYGCRQPDA